MMHFRLLLSLFVLATSAGAPCSADDPAETAVEYLLQGKLAEGTEALGKRLQENANEGQVRFGIGATQFLQSFEHLAQAFYRHGLIVEAPDLPGVRLPLPSNPTPEPLDYKTFRAIVQRFIDDLAQAADTLAQVNDPNVKLRVPVAAIRLDLNGDGKAEDNETLEVILAAVMGQDIERVDDEESTLEWSTLAFDYADVHWMIGYTNVLRALAEFYLAHDASEFFDATAHVFFRGAASPYEPLARNADGTIFSGTFMDLILGVHVIRWTPTEPERLKRAREHLLAMIKHSRLCWDAAEKEIDDDREWLPNARQTNILPVEMTADRIAGWRDVLDEGELILEGKKLVPHWRVGAGRGINLRKVFDEPRTFDLIAWVHGAAALPYLEEGDSTDMRTWNQLLRAFSGDFLFFAIWVN